MNQKTKCAWPGTDELMIKYHDEEWGVPCRTDEKLFEYIVLDTFQAGLSWRIILHKRENFRRALDNFQVRKIARYGEQKIKSLLNDVSINRNRAKIRGLIKNAQATLKIQREFGSLADYLWSFVKSRTIVHHLKQQSKIGTRSHESDIMSQDLKNRGFTFCGSTVCYAFMQGAGLVNDHLVSCFRHRELTANHQG